MEMTLKPRKATTSMAGTITISGEDLVKQHVIGRGSRLLIIEPRVPGVKLNHWVREQQHLLLQQLTLYGGVLFRGWEITESDSFARVIETATGPLLEYGERSSPRDVVSGQVYTSTTHPAAEAIFLHNEQSYNLSFPNFIAFCCLQEPKVLGATPVADVRRVLARLSPEIGSSFSEGYRYQRNFRSGLGLSWQEAFQTNKPKQVEAYCRENAIEFEWLSHDHLRTHQLRACLANHPRGGGLTWFNHLTFFHVTSLARSTRSALRANFHDRELPNNTFLADGSAVADAQVALIREAYEAEKFRFDWRRGDVLLLDNMLMAHGREPFEGERLIATVMSGPTKWADVMPTKKQTTMQWGGSC